MIPAAFGPIAGEYKVTKQKASYLTTSYTLLRGLTLLLLTPYANMYSRRPAYLVCYVLLRDLGLDPRADQERCRFSLWLPLAPISGRDMRRPTPNRSLLAVLSE